MILISKQAAIDALGEAPEVWTDSPEEFAALSQWEMDVTAIEAVPSAELRLTDDDFKIIRILLSAIKERLRIQHKLELAEEYERLIERFTAFASAQSEPIRINLNEPIKVRLTEWGKEIYCRQYDSKFPKEDENGYTEFQLWCFMELYGEHMGMIMPNVIEPLEIVYEGEL